MFFQKTREDMRLQLGVTLALCLILQSICSVSLQDLYADYGAGLNEGLVNEDITTVPMVHENDLGEPMDDQPSEGNSDAVAEGTMILSGVDDAEPSISVPFLREGEQEEPSGSSGSSGSPDTNSTMALPVVRSEDYPGENDTVEEYGPANVTTTPPEPPLDPLRSQQNESHVSTSNDTALNTTGPVAETNSTSPTNSTVITGTETNSTEVTSPTPAATNRSDVTGRPSGGPQDWVTNATEVNDTMDGLKPTTESLPEDKPTTTEPTTISTTETPEDIPNDATVPTTTTASPNATAVGKAAAGDSSGERGLSSGSEHKKNGKAWGAILGTALAVGFVGVVIYVLLKRRAHREFSHTKLVEEANSDPVLRLDNSEPLDLKFDGLGYYNPTLQGDNIQMTNLPAGHSR
ncbi:hypothetical protein ACEWY4_015925 [Coilia grayii]|uniref:Mucin-15 n=1 Tax=Coilia grayii TaxID=363190 RepID=A0ABD1JQA8_9TELE